ncbi:MAG TPA: CpsB/CapC family capsule biosynthesis tyrosine phosphatase [Candidatus Acidoferrum sp.]|jgi:protein-tyrosine phosphatase|nr:CpsB/CapC family capsule biosynthesis tyrosine phosphatase [Candidatus Acidoferrum sp.]
MCRFVHILFVHSREAKREYRGLLAETMVDIHCHILPGIDDGPEDIQVSLAMAENAIADGITHVVATPHASTEYAFDFRRVRALHGELQARLGGRLTLATGCDFHLNPENLEALSRDPAPFCINQRCYLLVEFNEFSIPPSMDQTLHELQLRHIRPIVTHPERNVILRTSPKRVANWVRLGCYVQITANSLTGAFGPLAQKQALRWIAQGAVHFIASDAHNVRSRPLKLRPAFELLRSQFGETTARGLCSDNPRAALDGRPLPFVPDLKEDPPPRRKRFFFF